MNETVLLTSVDGHSKLPGDGQVTILGWAAAQAGVDERGRVELNPGHRRVARCRRSGA